MTIDIADKVPWTGSVMWTAQAIHKRTPYVFDRTGKFKIEVGKRLEIIDRDFIIALIYEATCDEQFLAGPQLTALLNAMKITGRKEYVKRSQMNKKEGE